MSAVGRYALLPAVAGFPAERAADNAHDREMDRADRRADPSFPRRGLRPARVHREPGSARRRPGVRRQGLREVPLGQRRRRQGRARPRQDLAASHLLRSGRRHVEPSAEDDREDAGSSASPVRAWIREKPGTWSASSSRSTTSTRPATPRPGRRLFTEKKCVVCHTYQGAGGVVGPNLDHLTQFRSPIYVAAAMWNHGPQMAEKMKEKGDRAARPSRRPSSET